MSPLHKSLLALGALCGGLLLPTVAQADQYKLMLTIKEANGKQADTESFFGGFFRGEFFDCVRAKKKIEIGRKWPAGLLIGPDGKSQSFIILSARCEQIIPKMGQ